MLIVCLVEEHIFPVTALCSPIFEDPLLVNAVLSA